MSIETRVVTDGWLSPSSAEELRAVFSSEKSAAAMIQFFAKKAAAEYGDDGFAEFMDRIIGRQYARAVEIIYRRVESPIEKVFFASFLCSCLRNGLLLVVSDPPTGDFRDAVSASVKEWESLYKCFTFYRRLPEDARPKTFLRFLEMTGVERGELAQEDAKRLAAEVAVMFELRMIHAVHVTLQPTFNNFDGKRAARPDAVLWKPSDPKFKMVVECDGFETHGTHEAFARDRQRDRKFQALGYTVRRYSGTEIYNQPVQASTDLAHHLIDTKHSVLSGVAWERNAGKGKAPSPDTVAGWRRRLAEESKG